MNNTEKILRLFFFFFILLLNVSCLQGQNGKYDPIDKSPSTIQVAAECMNDYLPLLKGKKVAIVANQTSLVRDRHLVDTLLSAGINIQCVFAPEHGFRGEAGAGEKISSGIDKKTGLQVISLYGKHLKPTAEDLKNVDVVIFDIQDVGARFYTYISTLQYIMEACADFGKTLLILDRPNPNGFYIDGPILQKEFKSFVGMASIPVVHGMTVGEYAKMLAGEKWLDSKKSLEMKIIEVKNYSHSDLYKVPIRPSPNLPNMHSIYLYPSLCFFEGTAVSLGRGTSLPFQTYGYPGMKDGNIKFTPKNISGVVSNPPYLDTLCTGINLLSISIQPDSLPRRIELSYLLNAYKHFPDKKKFFNPFFEKLAGNNILRTQIEKGASENEIRKSWEPGLVHFKEIRKKYLLYPDFEN